MVASSGVSIHASTREATQLVKLPRSIADVSIHASTREATNDADSLPSTFEFRSTPPRGRRPYR